jgi:DNA-binding NarL/FixJ family response regulator
MATTVLIVDDKADFRELVRRVLGGAVEVVGEATDGEEAVQRAAGLAPDVVLMDLDISGLDAIRAAWKIKADRPATKMILLTAHDEEAYLAFTGKTGADALLRKQDIKTQLLSRIRAVTGQAASPAWDGQERRGKPLSTPSAWNGWDRRKRASPKKLGGGSPPDAEGP